MALTSRIQFIHLIHAAALRINHALRVAKRLATEDSESTGRFALGVGRGTHTFAHARLRGLSPRYEVTANGGGHDGIRRALSNDIFSSSVITLQSRPRSLVPKHVPQPYPPPPDGDRSMDCGCCRGADGHRSMMVVAYSGFAPGRG